MIHISASFSWINHVEITTAVTSRTPGFLKQLWIIQATDRPADRLVTGWDLCEWFHCRKHSHSGPKRQTTDRTQRFNSVETSSCSQGKEDEDGTFERTTRRNRRLDAFFLLWNGNAYILFYVWALYKLVSRRSSSGYYQCSVVHRRDHNKKGTWSFAPALPADRLRTSHTSHLRLREAT